MSSRQIYIPAMRPTTAGQAVDEEYFIRRNPTSIDQVLGQTNFSQPTPIMASVQVEGVDYPFYTRFYTAYAPNTRQWQALQQSKISAAQASTYGLGISSAIFAAPPDDTVVLPIAKMFYYPAANFGARRKTAFEGAAQSRPDAPGSWIEILNATEYTVTVCNLFSQIQEHLLETVNGGASWGSGLWTVDEVVAITNLRISRFLVETGIVQTRTTQAALAADQVYNLPTDLIDLRRAAWTAGTTTTELPRIDSLQADLWQDWEVAQALPTAHMLVPEKSLEIRLAPQPSANGTLDFIYVQDFTPIIADCSILPIPDEWTMFIKWGVIADMLSKEGEANDPQRASYGEQRFNEGVALAKLFMGTNQ